MSTSETITRTDLTNILNEVLPISGKVNFTTETKSIEVSVTAGSFVSAVVPYPTGKQAIGIAGVSCAGTGSANMVIWAFQMQSDGTSVSITNPSATTRTITIYVKYIVVDYLPITTGIVADYIVEQGTGGASNEFTYRKWNSGLAEFWGYVLIPSCPSGWSQTGHTFNFPFPIIARSWYVTATTYKVEVTYLSNVATGAMGSTATVETKCSSAVTNTAVRIYFLGTWK